jgi:hypothetical protein
MESQEIPKGIIRRYNIKGNSMDKEEAKWFLKGKAMWERLFDT